MKINLMSIRIDYIEKFAKPSLNTPNDLNNKTETHCNVL